MMMGVCMILKIIKKIKKNDEYINIDDKKMDSSQ